MAEDESQRIGISIFPIPLWNNMWQSPIVFIVIPFEERLKHIVQDMVSWIKKKLRRLLCALKKRLGDWK
jgi:tRNA 2-selenouridine synthase SelU